MLAMKNGINILDSLLTVLCIIPRSANRTNKHMGKILNTVSVQITVVYIYKQWYLYFLYDKKHLKKKTFRAIFYNRSINITNSIQGGGAGKREIFW
jgi:hypothetical protein